MSASDTARLPDEFLGFKADAKLAAEIRRVARLNDRSVSAEIRQALRDYLRQYANDKAAA